MELIEEEVPWSPVAIIYVVKVAYGDIALREMVKAAGGRWSAERKAWLLTGTALRTLQMEDHVIAWLKPQ